MNMATWRYKISLGVKYFSRREEKLCISKWPCNVHLVFNCFLYNKVINYMQDASMMNMSSFESNFIFW